MQENLLKDLLETPSRTGHEGQMVTYLSNYLRAHGYDFTVDDVGNVFVVKGHPGEGGFYPLVCAHTDTVHAADESVMAYDAHGIMVGYSVKTGARAGMGGDDKAGIFVCLCLLERLPCLKVALFVAEEIGCLGTKAADGKFFENVGYAIEWDSPGNDIVSFSCDGQQLFDANGPLIALAGPIMERHGAVKWQRHPYTDVAVLRRRFGFECLNLPCGYFKMHSDNDYVRVADTENAINLGANLVEALGCKSYPLAPGFVGDTAGREVTYLILG